MLAVFSFKYFIHIGGAISDEISYINIAHAYATGEWGDAVNGIWSPLYSWLMAPFLLSGFTSLYAIYISKIVSLIIGFFTIISVNMLLKIFKMDEWVKRALLVSLIPVILYFSLVYATPDLLFACILLFYLSIIFNSDYQDNMFNGFSCGLIGAVAFLSKSYAFPFFIVHFLLFNLIYYFKGLNSTIKRNTLKNLILGFLVFFVISGLWIGAISEKYGKLTISNAGEYNQALVGPESNNTDPVFYMDLYKPPNKSSTSILKILKSDFSMYLG